jgi:hypothetical protein
MCFTILFRKGVNMKRKIILHTISWVGLAAYLGLMVWSMYFAQVSPAPRYEGLNQVGRFFANTMFWTFQSNILTLGFLIIVMLSKYIPKIKISNNIFIIMSSYMAITMLLFWIALASVGASSNGEKTVPVLFQNSYDNVAVWIITTGLHFFTPVGLWIAHIFFLLDHKKVIQVNTWCKKDLIASTIFPAFYLLTVLIHGAVSLKIGPDTTGTDYTPGTLAFPYFFFDYTAYNGWACFFGISSGILLLIYGAQYLFLLINNKMSRGKSEKIRLTYALTKTNIVFAVLNIIVYTLIIAYAIYMIQDTNNYDFKNHKLDVVYILFFFIQFILLLGLPIIQITLISLMLAKKYQADVITGYILVTLIMLFCAWNAFYLSGVLWILCVSQLTINHISNRQKNLVA